MIGLHPLDLSGWFLEGIDFPIHIPVLETETETKTAPANPETWMKERVFHFTKKKMLDLKAKTNGENGLSDMKISSFQAVTAHLWKSIIPHSGLNRARETSCIVAADFRQRLNPPPEKECFGNVTNIGIATTTVGDLVDHVLGWAALQARNVKISKYGVGSRTVSHEWLCGSRKLSLVGVNRSQPGQD
ncbi:unnamed protein product [Thlaspi arvense]|uniref:Uncharacterized protein n=1 Tax=Thlaspi arvense TaxID=13288 RepID=A0AAU9SEM0_THLAR|nr:unnamed protein product [Thlaspi arvense]